MLQEGTKAKIQAVEGVVKDMRVDMNKNLLQINEDMNKVKAAIGHKPQRTEQFINESK